MVCNILLHRSVLLTVCVLKEFMILYCIPPPPQIYNTQNLVREYVIQSLGISSILKQSGPLSETRLSDMRYFAEEKHSRKT